MKALGVAAGALAGAIAGALLAGWLVVPRIAERSRGWKPATVLVTASALPRGADLGSTDLIALEVPEQFVDSSAVHAADTALVRRSRLVLPVEKGELLRWYAISDGYPEGACERIRSWW